jgi:hypothetical protein
MKRSQRFGCCLAGFGVISTTPFAQNFGAFSLLPWFTSTLLELYSFNNCQNVATA